MIYVVIFSFLGTIFATLIGASFGFFLKKLKKEITSFLSSFSVGSLFALSFLELFPESLENMEAAINDSFLSTLYILLIILGTGLLFYLMHEILHLLTHHHNKDHSDEETCKDHAHSVEVFNEKSIGFASFIFLIAISIHNIPEGLTLGITFSKETSSIPLDGILTSIVLLLHNFIIGFTLFNSFISHNKKKGLALLMTSLSAIPAFVFSLIGYFISSFTIDSLYTSILFAISTGSLLYVIFIELIPSVFKEYKSKYTFIYILIGIVIFTLILAIGGHQH